MEPAGRIRKNDAARGQIEIAVSYAVRRSKIETWRNRRISDIPSEPIILCSRNIVFPTNDKHFMKERLSISYYVLKVFHSLILNDGCFPFMSQ